MGDSGIDAEATLMVRVMAISFEMVVQALLCLNPKGTEEQAKRKAEFDVDGNLISWDLGYLSIKELPECIGNCTALQTLNCYICWQLQSLPPTFGDLKSLTVLDVAFTNIKELPEGIGGGTALQVLDLSYCEALESLPNSIGNCTALQTLDCRNCRNCHKLESLPPSI